MRFREIKEIQFEETVEKLEIKNLPTELVDEVEVLPNEINEFIYIPIFI